MIRSCIIPADEFVCLNTDTITEACKNMYDLYEQLFGATNCTYSIHVVCSHLMQIRNTGPLTERSAFAFESFYGELRRSFVTGMPSTLKQMMQTVYLRRNLNHQYICRKERPNFSVIASYIHSKKENMRAIR